MQTNRIISVRMQRNRIISVRKQMNRIISVRMQYLKLFNCVLTNELVDCVRWGEITWPQEIKWQLYFDKHEITGKQQYWTRIITVASIIFCYVC